MCYQAQEGFRGIFVCIPEHQKVYLVYVPSTRKVISSYDVVFDESFSSALSYTSRPYSEAMTMRPALTYTPYVTYSRETIGDIITFARFEEKNILTETRNDAESGDESDSESLMMSKQNMENLDSNEQSNHDLISTEMLEDIRDGSKTHPNSNKKEARYKIRDRVKRKESQWKGALKSMQSMEKGLHKVFSTIVNRFNRNWQLWENLVQKFPISFQNLENLLK